MDRKRKKPFLCLIIGVLLLAYPLLKVGRVYWDVSHSYSCDKQIIVFQSDDWGMCGTRGKETFDNLAQKGIRLDNNPWAYYSLETVEDLEKLYSVLEKHEDSRGNHPVFTFNFIVTNPDFQKISESGYKKYYHKKLSDGLSSKWKRGNLYETYLRGIELGLVYPGYHGREHFNYGGWLELLAKNDSAATALFAEQMTFGYAPLWEQINGQYIALPARFLDYATQEEIVEEGVAIFKELFGFGPLTTIAPGYYWNDDTERIWSEVGIKMVQGSNRHYRGDSKNGRAMPGKQHYQGERNRYGMVYLVRNVDFEPWLERLALRRYLAEIETLFAIGEPVIISTHSINYTSSIENFRDDSLVLLDSLLTALERRFPDLLYLTDVQLALLFDGYSELSNGERVNSVRRNSPRHNLTSTISLTLHKIHRKKLYIADYLKKILD